MSKYCVLIFLFISSIEGYSQTLSSPGSIQELLVDSTAWNEPIPASEVTNYIQSTNDFLSQIRNDIPRKNLENIFKNEFDSLSEIIQELDQRFVIDSTTIISPTALENQQNEWMVYSEVIADWNLQLTDNIQWIEQTLADIKKITILWNNTRQSLITLNAAPGVIERVNLLRNNIRTLNSQLTNSFNNLLDLQVRLADIQNTVNQKLSLIQQSKDLSERSLLIPERPVLWRELSQISGNSSQFFESFREVLQTRKANIYTYISNYRYYFIVSLTLFIVLSIFLFVIKKKSASWFENDEEEHKNAKITRKIIDLPVAVAFLITALLMINVILPVRPFYILELVRFIGIFPLLVILFSFTHRNSHQLIMILAVAAIISRIDNLLYEFPIMERLTVLFNSILLFIVVIVWNNYKELVSLEQGRGKILVHFFRWVGLISLPVAIISNVFGNTTLASFLVNGYIDSLLVLLFVFILYLVARSIIHILLSSPWTSHLNALNNNRITVEKHATNLVYLALFIWMVLLFFRSYQMEDGLKNVLSSIFLSTIKIGTLTITLTDVLLFFLVLWLSIRLSRIIGVVLEEDILKRTKTSEGVTATIITMTKLAIVVIGFLLAIAASGFQLSSITILISAFGVGIGFGLQNIFNNFVSGIIIASERPVEVGDTIQVGNLTGSVKSVGLRSSVVRTWDGSEVIVPNGNLISNDLINWTHSDRQIRITIPFGVAYGTDPHKVIEIASRIAQEHEKALVSPGSYTLFTGFGDSSLDFMLRFWTDDYDNWIFTKSEVILKLHDALYENGIEIPFPQRDLHLRSVDDNIGNMFTQKDSEKNIRLLEKKYKEEDPSLAKKEKKESGKKSDKE